MVIHAFDVGITTFFNHYAQHSKLFDLAVNFLATNHLFKGGVLSVILWWVWFRPDEPKAKWRDHVLATLIGCVLAIVLARCLALTLPFRLRPMHEPGLHFLLPYGVLPEALDGWSSLPSDHAALFFALAIGLLFANKRAGLIALLYTIFFIALPRIYLGLHYTTDILAGAGVGLTLALACNLLLINWKFLSTTENWTHARPHLFYPLLFLFTYQIADMFDSSRALARAVAKVLQLLSH